MPHVLCTVLGCFSRVQFFATLWTVAVEAALYMGFSRQEYWSYCHVLLPNPRIESAYLKSPTLAGRFFTTSTIWEAMYHIWRINNTSLKLLKRKQSEKQKWNKTLVGQFQSVHARKAISYNILLRQTSYFSLWGIHSQYSENLFSSRWFCYRLKQKTSLPDFSPSCSPKPVVKFPTDKIILPFSRWNPSKLQMLCDLHYL